MNTKDTKDIKQLKFLVIDDCPNIRKMLRGLLRDRGVELIHLAADPRAALKHIISRDYDVILCDYEFNEGQNGQQFHEEIRHNKLLPYGTLFIMITAQNLKNSVMAAVENRPDDYINKPFPKKFLMHRLEKLLYKKEILRPIYAAYNEKDYLTAIRECDKAMAKHKKAAFDIGKLKGEIAIAANNFNVAEKVYDQALAFRPFDWALYGKAKSLFHKKEYLPAKDILLDLLTDYNHYIEAYDLLAKIYHLENEPQKTQETLQKAALISPKTISRQQFLAKVALENNDQETAEKALKASIHYGKFSCYAKVSNYTELAKIYLANEEVSQAATIIEEAKERFANDQESLFHTSILDSILQFNLGKINEAKIGFYDSLKKIPKSISSMTPELQVDMIHNSKQLGEEDITNSLQDDINGKVKLDSGETLEKYKFLLINSEGKKLYQENKIYESIRCFEHAAQNLTDDISVNMNAAQAIIVSLKKDLVADKNEAKDLKVRARQYLDVSRTIDSENEKYIKLEELYNEVV